MLRRRPDRRRAARALLALALTVSSSWGASRPARAENEKSIYQVDPLIDGAVIGASVAVTASLYLFAAGAIDVRCPCNPQEVNALDRPTIGNNSELAANISNVTAGLALLAPPVLGWFALREPRPYLEDLTVYAEAIAVSGALLTVSKQIAQRPFPRTYAGDPSQVHSSNGYRSFYSGHVALVATALTTAAVTVTERHGPALAAWLVAAGVTASIAAERVAAGWHFPTDVMAGAAAGTAIGVVVPALHLRHLRVMPTTISGADGPAGGLMVAGRWR
jgi:membrane-associated phospholipid phosphatase